MAAEVSTQVAKASPEMKIVRWFIGVSGGVLVALWVVVAVGSRTSVLREALLDALREKLDTDVELQSFEADMFPLVRITGSGLKLRLRGQQEARPLIEVASFEVQSGIWGLLQRPRRFRSVTLDGLKISIPPRLPHDRKPGSAAAANT